MNTLGSGQRPKKSTYSPSYLHRNSLYILSRRPRRLDDSLAEVVDRQTAASSIMTSLGGGS